MIEVPSDNGNGTNEDVMILDGRIGNCTIGEVAAILDDGNLDQIPTLNIAQDSLILSHKDLLDLKNQPHIKVLQTRDMGCFNIT